MRKNKGYIFISSVFVLLFLSIAIYFISTTINRGGLIQKNRLTAVQGEYCTESLLNIFFAQDEIIEIFKEIDTLGQMEQNNLRVDIDGVEWGKISGHKIPYHKNNLFKKGRAYVLAKTCYKGFSTSKMAIVRYIHPGYLLEKGSMDTGDLFQEEVQKLREGFEEAYYYNHGKGLIMVEEDCRLGKIKGETSLYVEEILETEDGEVEIIPHIIQKISMGDFVKVLPNVTLEIDSGIILANFFHLEGVLRSEDQGNKIKGVLYLGRDASVQEDIEIQGYVVNLYDMDLPKVQYNESLLKEYRNILPFFYDIEVLNIKNTNAR